MSESGNQIQLREGETLKRCMWGDLILDSAEFYAGIIPRGSTRVIREGDRFITTAEAQLPKGLKGKVLGIWSNGNLGNGGSERIVAVELDGASEAILVSPFTITTIND
ncbi:hypothetical protein IPJ70_03210 [Candidatus Campbellbacteria bacterium]|nr:MAG: hypothetical protein IPJ70_03210 [Candidatus Campbellbacteria bacterium]